MRQATRKYNYKSRIEMKINQVNKPRLPVLISKYVFRNNCPQHEKINFIDHIVWINLASSKNRFDQMNTLLNSLTIPHTRIEAVNGKDANFLTKCASLNTKMTPLEIACSLSHVKAINSLKNLSGQFFMVCEDDISLENLRYFDITLFDIIKNAPYFDILMIYHSFPSELPNEYTDWNLHAQKSKNQNEIAGAVAYIIRKSCLQSFPNFDINSIPSDFNLADRYIYKKVKTIVYKYNFITIQCNNSIIHENHLQMHKEWKENHILIIQKNLTCINRKYKSCKIFIHQNAKLFPELIKKICQNFVDSNTTFNKLEADIIIYHEQDDNVFVLNQKYNILIKTSEQTYKYRYNCILNQDSELIIPQDEYLKLTNWLIVN